MVQGQEPPVGVITEPAHGSSVSGDPAGQEIHVEGTYDGDATLSVQVLSNPDDLTSWTTVASTQTKSGKFAVDVDPLDQTQWPRGGIVRLRVIDGDGHALARAADDASPTIAIANRANPPATWSYLSEQPVGSIDETRAYYTAIGAPTTLQDFQQRFGFRNDNEVGALYYNAGDLGIGRDMHCRAVDGGGAACFVRNFGEFGGDPEFALAELLGGQPFATVAMVYTPPIDAPNAVTFMVYGADGALADEAQLDTRGDNTSIPQNCLNCHGGRSDYDAAGHAARGARFLAFDPAAFEFEDRQELSLRSQQKAFSELNALVADAVPTATVHELIDGMFTGDRYDAEFVPEGWNASKADTQVYREVVAPYCRSCHAAFDQSGETASFASAAGLRAKSAETIGRICNRGPRGMPTAEATAKAFYRSGARAVLLAWLDAPGACAP